jgi:hypothetical protein
MKTVNIDTSLTNKGIERILSIRINILKTLLESNPDKETIKEALDDYYGAREVAHDSGINTEKYDRDLIQFSEELKNMYKIQLK